MEDLFVIILNIEIHIHITGDSRAEQNIARARACNISYVPEGASPRRTYFRIARRAHRARVLYDHSARNGEEGYHVYPLAGASRLLTFLNDS